MGELEEYYFRYFPPQLAVTHAAATEVLGDFRLVSSKIAANINHRKNPQPNQKGVFFFSPSPPGAFQIVGTLTSQDLYKSLLNSSSLSKQFSQSVAKPGQQGLRATRGKLLTLGFKAALAGGGRKLLENINGVLLCLNSL